MRNYLTEKFSGIEEHNTYCQKKSSRIKANSPLGSMQINPSSETTLFFFPPCHKKTLCYLFTLKFQPVIINKKEKKRNTFFIPHSST